MVQTLNIMLIWVLTVYREMIKFAKEHDINRYNFYGITGDFSEDAEDAGTKFKEGFNADGIYW